MRFLPLLLLVAACGGHPTPSTLPSAPAITPARDLGDVRTTADKVDPGARGMTAKDPRVVDLDIIRIRAGTTGVGGDPELTSVASADLFRAANEAAKAGRSQDAIARYRQLVTEFPDSIYAPISVFNIAAVYDKLGDYTATVTALQELVKAYPAARESVEGHLYMSALQAEHKDWPATVATLDAALARPQLTYPDRVEAYARKGYVEIEQKHYDAAAVSLDAAIGEWRKAPRLDDPYYIAMANYYRGELAHQKFLDAPLRPGDDEMVADLEAKRVLAVQAYDRWKEALGFKQAYWATAAGYQMSQIFVELWQAHVKAPYPKRIDASTRPKYVIDVHERVREHLEKALEGHRMNVELAKAFGVETSWSKGSETRAVQLLELLAKEAQGQYVTPESGSAPI